MLNPVTRLIEYWQSRSIGAKLLLPIIGLMLISLTGSTLAFVGGTALTQKQLLAQQSAVDAERVTTGMAARVEAADTAASLLANDPQIVDAVPGNGEADLAVLNARAVAVRERFGLDLVQIYDRQGQARTNLVLSSLYRESSLLDAVQAGQTLVHAAGDRLLLLSRREMADDAGTVIAGIDLETELNRLALRYRLSADLGLATAGSQVSTRAGLSFDTPDGPGSQGYVQHVRLTLGTTPVSLLLARAPSDVARVTNTGLRVMVGSSLLTTALLIGLGVLSTRSVARPIRRLAAAATGVAEGNLTQQIELSGPSRPGRDEIGLLTSAFNRMVSELGELYGELEHKVTTRTQELLTAAEVAYAISSSLELDEVLRMAVYMIQGSLDFDVASVFIVEPGSEVAELRQATGEIGRALMAQRFKVPLGARSLVGTAAAGRRPCVARDVSVEPNYYQVLDLKDIRSEAAIPLLVGETVVGVLDIQSRRQGTFTDDVLRILTTLANQLATGVHHARLYEQVQRHAGELEWRVAERTQELAEANTRLEETNAQLQEANTHLAEANEQLKELDQLKSKFVFDASHELRSPLTSIKGYGDLLVKGAVGTLSEDQRRFLQMISGSTDRLMVLINDLLDLSRIESGRANQELTALDLNAIARQVVEAHQPQAQAAGLALFFENGTSLPAVRGIHDQLVQVATNLVSNAVRYTPAGEVRVSTYLDSGGDQVCLQVQDTGSGIAPEDLPHIFERFYRSESARSSGIQGTGLGLSIVQEIVALHGGEIAVDSMIGQGSTFRVWLPLAPVLEAPGGDDLP